MKQSSFQDIILALQNYWAAHGCLITQPYYTQVGAGTMNPATFLRVLGPEPWNVAYVEPSVRPDDGRYGENPNRFQLHYQYQVILKPDPGNPQELYLDSLKALGIDPRQHDIRFVEDNWEQPAISAWGLGWEVWLDGQEITQFTYFQQVGGLALDPVAVELTYGLERILIALNNAKAIWDEPWGTNVKYGEVRKQEEFEHSKYYFEVADVERVRKMYDLYRAEAEACLAAGLVLPAHDYVLKCSHVFNTLDTRGAIGVTERQAFFGQMRGLARAVADAYLEQRKQLGYPLLGSKRIVKRESRDVTAPVVNVSSPISGKTLPFLLEIGTEELPAGDVETAHVQLREKIPALLDELHLEHGPVRIFATPRRLAVLVDSVAPRQPDREDLVKGPPADKAFDKDGKPTPAALGFARKNGLEASALEVHEMDGGKYVAAVVKQAGKSATDVLSQVLPEVVRALKFDKSMKWNDSGEAFSRPIRWLVALIGNSVIPFEFAGVTSGSATRGLRPNGSPEIMIESADKYLEVLREAGIMLDGEKRKESIAEQVTTAATSVHGEAILDNDLLGEVTNLVEEPTAVLGSFEKEFLSLPREVLISTMKKHQRYFAITDPQSGKLLPNFIAIRNGDSEHLEVVRQGNEHVLAARFADADFFVREDLKHKLDDFRPQLSRLIFQKQLGSMLDKSERMLKLSAELAQMLDLDPAQRTQVQRAALLAKADLVTQMVTEMTSLQGIIGREYAVRAGESQTIADAIGEQYQPIPKTIIGLTVALADRLDSLVGLFAAGLAPTGAKDPFGLRRAAIGVVQPLIEHDLTFDLEEAVKKAAKLQPIPMNVEIQEKVLDFISGRLNVVLKESGSKYDVVEAILAAQSKDPAGCARAVVQLTSWVEREDWHEILPAFARCVRITRDQKTTFQISEKTFKDKEEKELYAALLKAETTRNKGQESVDTFLNAFVPMIPAINEFFDKVLVMAEEKSVRENRLALLQRISSLPQKVADLSKLEGF